MHNYYLLFVNRYSSTSVEIRLVPEIVPVVSEDRTDDLVLVVCKGQL